MFLASAGAPEGYVDALSGYASKRKERLKKKKMLEDARAKEPVTEKTLKVISASKSKEVRASHSAFDLCLSSAPYWQVPT